MKIGKWKWLASLLATACCAVCVGVGVAVSVPAAESITAQAATSTWTYEKLVPLGSSSTSQIYAYPGEGIEKPTVSSWDYGFTFVEGTGDGILWNGEPLTEYELKQPGDFFINLIGKTATAGDELVLDGTFNNTTADAEFVFENCGFFYNGSEWIAFTAPMTVHNIGALMLHGNSNVGGASGLNNVLYLQRADGEALPVLSWDYAFTVAKGSFTVNGVSKTPGGIKSTGDGFYWEFDALNENDIITIAGTFYCASQNVKYVVDASSFQWNGSGWSALTYTTGEIGKVAIGNGSSATAVYLDRAGGGFFEITDGTWSEKLTFTAGSGVGVTLNGKQISMDDIKIPNNMYVGLGEGATAKGDVLVIGGTFYNENLRVRYVVEESKFEWSGTAWIPYVNTVYNVSAIKAESDSNASTVYLTPKDGNGNSFGAGDWNNVYTFAVGSGDGLWLNDTQLTTTDIKQPGAFFIALGETAAAGDVLKIDGAYYNVTTDKKIVFDDCYLQFNGTSWETYVNYKVYNVSAIRAENSSNASTVYLTPKDGDGDSFGGGDWDNVYTFEVGSGDGLWLNDTQLSTTDIKLPGSFFIALGETAVAGDVLKIDGAYYNETTEKKIVFDNCKLEFDGSAWVEYVPKTTTVYTVTKVGTANGTTASVLYLYALEGDSFGAGDWDNVYTYAAGALKLNGENVEATVKQPGDLYIPLGKEAVAGDVLTINGEFYNETTDKKFVFDNCQLRYNGSTWALYTNPTVHEIGSLVLHTNSSVGGASGNNAVLYLQRADGEALPFEGWENPFTVVSGGLTVNGEAVSLNEMQSTGDGLYFSFEALAANDILTISGTFYCANQNIDYVIEESNFQWTGSGWKLIVEPTVHEIGSLELHVNSSVGGASGNNAVLYLQRADGEALPFEGWENPFTVVSGGLTVNGEAVSLNEMQSTGDGLFFSFGALTANDILTVAGTFYCEKQNIQYVIEESSFQWTGSGWVVYVPPIEYTTYTVTKLGIANGTTASELNLYVLEGDSFGAGDWDTVYTYAAGALKLNNENITAVIKQPGDLYVPLGKTAAEGDILTLNGEFYNEEKAVKFVFDNCQLQWNGSAWVEYVYVPPVEYEIHNLGVMQVAIDSQNANATANAIYLLTSEGENLPVTDGTWGTKFTFRTGGVTYNGEALALGDIKNPGALYIALGTEIPSGGIITVAGTLYNDNLLVEFVIEESQFVWNGSAWETYVYVPPVEYEIHNLGVMTLHTNSKNSNAQSGQLYLNQESGAALPYPDADWNTIFVYESGDGLRKNGNPYTLSEMKSTNVGLFLGFAGVSVGDMVSISGTFVSNGTGLCESLNVKYVISESKFVWNGSVWMPYLEGYEDEDLEFYDVVTMLDLSLGHSETIAAAWDRAGSTYTPSAVNTTGSVKFRFGIQGSNLDAGGLDIRLRGSAWDGIQFKIAWKQIFAVYQYKETNDSYVLSNGTYYVIELGAIDLKDGENIWIYAKVDGMLVLSDTKPKTSTNGETGAEFGTYTNPSVSLSADGGWASAPLTLTDPDHVIVTYMTSEGTITEYANKNYNYEILSGRSYKTFVVWVDSNNTYYYAGDEIEATESLALTAVEISFEMEEGASIRISTSADYSGIRFTTNILASDLTYLKEKGITVVEYGTLILPYDYLEEFRQEPNLDEYVVDETILKIPSTKQVENGNYVQYRGAMQKLYSANYERAFAGRGYMTLTIGEKTITVYTPFNTEDNVRSIRKVAQAFKADTSAAGEGELRYNTLPTASQEIVDAYAGNGIDLMDYDSYLQNTLDVIAWYHPELDSANGYDNANNDEIAEKMVNAGIKAVYLDGMYHIELNSAANIEATRQIIKFFWKHGIKTIAFADVDVDNPAFGVNEIPDFSDCEGFIGFLMADEPTSENFEKIAAYAEQFNTLYAGTDVTFMVNLFPSYASIFQENSNSFWGSSSTLNKTTYKTYLQAYCDDVLSNIDGEKWLSLDTYPVNADYTLTDTFLFDLAMLKYYSLSANATSHVALQSSGWVENENSDKNRMPTEAEMRMQAYAAMAFGIDSISWWSYSDKRGDNQSNPTDSNENYEPFATVNNELAAIEKVYKAFDWKGVIIGKSDKGNNFSGKNADYDAYNTVQGELGTYKLSASNTKHLSSVATNQNRLNYLLGVMEDMNGNEGYVLANYNTLKANNNNAAQTVTLTFKTGVTKVVIYHNGIYSEVDVSNGELKISLKTGDGVIILPSAM
ncbi:MAG: hypothetical protein E7380_00805 [Clostridiales bacterium]|nr:hypothetical protein [Clostridiales bacterium]